MKLITRKIKFRDPTTGEIKDTLLLSEGNVENGLSADVKAALMNAFNHVVWDDDDPSGQTYITALQSALYPPIAVTNITLNTNSLSFGTLNSTQQLTATTTPTGGAVTWSSSNTSVVTVSATGLVTAIGYGNATITATSGSVSATCSVAVAQATVTSISAVYTQSGTVYDTDSLDSLKSDLVVTATWSNQTTSTVASADYTLSGTLTGGTSTITVSYGGKTTTFNVTVTAVPVPTAIEMAPQGTTLNELADIGTPYADCISANTNRFRTADAVAVSMGDVIDFSISGVNDTLGIYVLWFDADKNYTGIHASEWDYSGSYTVDQDYPYIGFACRTQRVQSNISSGTVTATLTEA